MLIYEIIKKIQEFCPENTAEEWDNPGIQIGNIYGSTENVYVTLDVTEEVADEAVKKKCGLILSHHPLFFSPFKKIITSEKEGRIIKKLIENEITVYSAHTNMDKAARGINYVLAKKAGILNPTSFTSDEIGLIGDLKDSICFSDYAKKISDILDTHLKISGDNNKQIKRTAVCSGSGAEYADAAFLSGADVLITSDIKYHQALESKICLIDAGHYPTEIFVKDIFKDILKDTELNIIYSEIKDVFDFI